MADKSFQRLSNVTLSAIRAKLEANPVFNSLSTDAQKNYLIARAQDKVNKYCNDNDLDYYRFDCVGDADSVLAPSAAGASSIFTEYLEITLDYNGGDPQIAGVSATAVGDMALDTGNTDTDLTGSLAVYTIAITGGTIDGRMQIESAFPKDVEFERVNSTSFKVHLAKNHIDMSIFLKKRKNT